MATPLIALQQADNCGGCHRPGRSERPVLDRRCTLDCQGCHIDPAGGGPRNQWGYYFSQDQLATVNFFKPQDPLEDNSRFDIHYDGRLIRRRDEAGNERTTPMSSELSLRLRPFVKYVHFTYQALLFGRLGDSSFTVRRDDRRRFLERYSAMIDNLPLAVYVRGYRGAPMYGLRRSNHALWIRERVGLDQFALTDAVEFGATPTVPFFRTSYMRGDPLVAPEDRQVGTSLHGGLRGVTLGWHINGSAWDTASQKAAIKMRALGFGLKPWRFSFMGERNWRRVTPLEREDTSSFASPALKLHPSSTISEYTAAFMPLSGMTVGHVLEELDEELDDAEDSSQRRQSAFIDLHPIPYLQFEIWRRWETGTRHLADTLGVAHVYVDF